MKRFEGVGLTAVLAATAALTACSGTQDPTRVCVDTLGRRIADGQCAPASSSHGSGGGRWYFISGREAADEGVPALGDEAREGSYTPDFDVSYGAAPEGGIARGGFGSSGESGGDGGDGGGHGGGGDGGGE